MESSSAVTLCNWCCSRSMEFHRYPVKHKTKQKERTRPRQTFWSVPLESASSFLWKKFLAQNVTKKHSYLRCGFRVILWFCYGSIRICFKSFLKLTVNTQKINATLVRCQTTYESCVLSFASKCKSWEFHHTINLFWPKNLVWLAEVFF